MDEENVKIIINLLYKKKIIIDFLYFFDKLINVTKL
jgi:hypothetical protein